MSENDVKEIYKLLREVLQRLATLEATIDTGINQRFKGLEKDMDDFKEERKWLWRTTVGAAIAAVAACFKAYFFGGKGGS